MKKLALLKTLTSIVFIISVIGLFFTIPFILIVALMPEQIPFEINGGPATAASIESILLLLALTIGFAFFVYALYLFKRVLELFEKRKIFHIDVIKLFDQIGKAIIVGYLIMAIPNTLYKMLVEGVAELFVEFNFDRTFFTLGLGLFFMVLSEIFLMAKTLKEENDLTV